MLTFLVTPAIVEMVYIKGIISASNLYYSYKINNYN